MSNNHPIFSGIRINLIILGNFEYDFAAKKQEHFDRLVANKALNPEYINFQSIHFNNIQKITSEMIREADMNLVLGDIASSKDLIEKMKTFLSDKFAIFILFNYDNSKNFLNNGTVIPVDNNEDALAAMNLFSDVMTTSSIIGVDFSDLERFFVKAGINKLVALDLNTADFDKPESYKDFSLGTSVVLGLMYVNKEFSMKQINKVYESIENKITGGDGSKLEYFLKNAVVFDYDNNGGNKLLAIVR